MVARFFVYGTLKPDELAKPIANEFQQSLIPQILESESAIAHGQLFDLPFGYPAMTIAQGIVRGNLITIDDAFLPILDEYETHDLENIQAYDLSIDYTRELIEVFTPTHQLLGQAWAYVMTESAIELINGVLIQSGIWHSTG